MKLHKGDTIMHWTHGIGQIVSMEERALAGSTTIYYVVQVRRAVGALTRAQSRRFRYLIARRPHDVSASDQ